MRVTFCGVRGSTPAPGADFLRYGGHTSCVALAHDGEAVDFVLDGGTGLRHLSGLLDEPFGGTVVLGHLHWDHVQGLPFFGAARRPGARLDLRIPAQGEDAAAVLARGMGPPHFPITAAELDGWSVGDLQAGEHDVDAWSVMALDIPHGGGRTFGYRVSDGTATVAYLSDHCPTQLGDGPDGIGVYHDAALALADGVDLLIHDAHLTADQLPERAFLGHAAAEYAVALAERTGSRRVALFHHDPARTDAEIDALTASLAGTGIELFAAAQGQTLDV
jgi:phosphoribosyl 1,2-cyclic phosphodiesterase